MVTSEQILIPIVLPPLADRLRRAVAAYLARFKGQCRVHTDSDLRAYLTWCHERGLDPLAAQRPHVELYVRWMQEVRRYKPSTVSRPMAVVAGVLPHLRHRPGAGPLTRRVRPPPQRAPRITHPGPDPPALRGHAGHRPPVPNLNDFALVAMLGLLGLQIFEACGANIEDLGEEHGHGVLKVHPKATRSS